ncbi:12132_t:CDS:1, partial [Gigaspora margarita]
DSQEILVNRLEDANINNQSLSFLRMQLLTLGSALLLIPADDVIPIHKQIPGSKIYSEQFIYIIPCNTTAVVSLKFGGVDYKIPSRDLIFDKLSNTKCILSIILVRNSIWDFWL